ncbi:hypothetical protein RJ639_018915 [Escallonia herrerae]|uniref:FAD dependent oxidoreductase domain-containing protein n=1 Tax=Escallonia herrerae TaxID=1293975 RepID=A0AA88V9V5_9ASTE|nr:hypothetical protein RJ639_018915 [Escallonia herrerae]
MEDQHEPPKRVVVCGGGVIGVCTAYFLAKKGAAVTLIEKSSIACAASGKAGGFLALDWCDGGPLSSLARASFDLHCSLARELNGPQSYGYRALDTLSLSITESEPAHGRKPSSKLPSWVDGPSGNARPIGTTETTAQVHPQLFTRALLSKATSLYGVEVVIGKLERVEVEEGRVRAVALEDREVVKADAVVLALGPWTSKLSLLSSLFRVYGLKAHSIVLEPKEPDAITPHALFLSYYSAQGGKPMDPEVYPRPTELKRVQHWELRRVRQGTTSLILVYGALSKDREAWPGAGHPCFGLVIELIGEVYICGLSAEAEVPDDPPQVVPNPESIRVLKRVAKTVSSHFGEGERVIAEQACFLPCTDDSAPVIGEVPGVKGCYVATGHNCWGILNGPATGAAVAELVVDGRASLVDLTPFSPARFSRGRKW